MTPSQNKDVQKKIRGTMVERYGVEVPIHNENIKNKIKQTNIERYGSENVFSNEEIKERIKINNLKRIGVEHHTQTEDHKEKMKQFYIDEYGVEHFSQLDEVKEKIRNTMYENNTVPTSKNQLYLWRLYGGELNFPYKTSSIDIAYSDEMIGIEYDGGGHWLRVTKGKCTEEEFARKEMNRNYGLYRGGWKMMRIISKEDKLPQKEKLIEMLDFAKSIFNEGRSFVEFDIDNGTVKTSQYIKEYDFGKLQSYYSICKEVG